MTVAASIALDEMAPNYVIHGAPPLRGPGVSAFRR